MRTEIVVLDRMKTDPETYKGNHGAEDGEAVRSTGRYPKYTSDDECTIPGKTTTSMDQLFETRYEASSR